MGTTQKKGIFRKRILSVILLLLLSGCVTLSKAPKIETQKKPLDNVLAFRDLRQVDLDNDGIKEIVAIYATNNNLSGVKVIKFHDEKGEVIFERVFDSPDVKFQMKDNIPAIIVEKTNQNLGCTRGLEDIYRWNGKAFTLKKEQ